MIPTRVLRTPDHTTSTPEPLSDRPEFADTWEQTRLAPRDPAVLSPRPALINARHRISVFDLHAYYGAEQAVKGVTIEFPPHQVSAIIGPSGCGKSTLLRCINRMHEEIPGAYAEGKVMLDDHDLYASDVNVTAVRRLIGMVFQKANPFPTMSIFENVASGPRLTGTKGKRLSERVNTSLREVGLWDEVKDRLDSPGVGLSGGQQQRLCIARAIAVEPEVILMDEPCSALDPHATSKIEALIDELKKHYTIVIVTHNMPQAGRIADSTVFMLDGQLIEHGLTREILTAPKDERTERYVSGKFG
jgi:phosphate transport system ATP-binding protein